MAVARSLTAAVLGSLALQTFALTVATSTTAAETADTTETTAEETTTTTLNADQLNALAIKFALQMCQDAHLSCRKGAWLYGDYLSYVDVWNVVDCNELCEVDPKCFHWNFHATYGKGCDLKTEGAGFNEDAGDYVGGNVVHSSTVAATTAATTTTAAATTTVAATTIEATTTTEAATTTIEAATTTTEAATTTTEAATTTTAAATTTTAAAATTVAATTTDAATTSTVNV